MILMMMGGLMALLIVLGITYKPGGDGESEWEKLAARLGLRFLDRGLPDLEIQGELEGYELRVNLREVWVWTGSSEVLEHFTAVSIRLHEEEWKTGASLMMEKEPSALSKGAEKWLGGYFFSGLPSEKVERTLEKDEVQRELMDLGAGASSVHLLNGELKVEQSRFINDGGELEALIRRLMKTAKILDEGIASRAGAPKESAVSRRGREEEHGIEEEAHAVDGAADW